jgi:RNA polymerase sigma-70 factor (TIGR02957 family)
VVSASAEKFVSYRSRLFGLAYQMLGEAGEAEDVVQDAYLRWTLRGPAGVDYPSAWLMKVVTNLCLNRLASARSRRETYVGAWLPEPVLTGDGALGPFESTQQRESVSFALLTLMERLTPTERAVFVLREAFDYTHRQIAEILDISPTNCRQLHARARMHVGDPRPRFVADRAQWRKLAERFLAAAQGGDVAALQELLAADVKSTADGGGRVGGARRTVVGRDRVSRYLAGAVSRRTPPGIELFLAEVNAGPAVLGFADGVLAGVMAFEIDNGQITAVHIVANPDKLTYLGNQFARLSHSQTLSGS